MTDIFSSYERGLEELLKRLGEDHPRYAEALTLENRLRENIVQARLYGDTETRRAERAQIVDALNQLTLGTVGVSFKELCEPAQDEPIPAVQAVSNPKLSTIWQQRLHNLADNVAQDLALLKEYEDALRYEDDPRRRARYRREIKQLRESVARYRQEYDELRRQVIGDPPAVMQDVSIRLQQMDAKLDTLLTGQTTIRNDLSYLRQTLLAHYEARERATVATIIEQLDQAQLTTVQAVLDALEAGLVSKEMRQVLNPVQEMLAALQQHGIFLPGQQGVAEVVAAPTLDLRHKLKITLPIIPLLLGYEGELALGSRIDLEALWERLVARMRGQAVYPVIPLGISLPMQDLLPHLALPSGYRYLGQLDGLATDHFYREQDRHVALWFPAMPGVSRPFLIDKYAITARQFSDCLNDLLSQGVVRMDRHPTSGVQRCVDMQDRPLVFDALDRWQRGPTPREPWLHTATPWGMTCQDGVWQPVPGSELLPATLVTWWGARIYSLWAHQQPVDLLSDEVAYLPTIQQWQMAALWDVPARRERRYPWGDTWRRECVNYAGYWADREVRETDWERLWATQASVYRQTRPLPVADLDDGRSPIGCVQMIGNVWEWCADNPDGVSSSRAVKGGACLSPQEHCSPGWHVAWRPEQGNEYIGFRCCFPLMG